MITGLRSRFIYHITKILLFNQLTEPFQFWYRILISPQDSISTTTRIFFSFSVTEKAARKGVNPKTKQPIEIAARKAIKFKPGAELNDKVQ